MSRSFKLPDLGEGIHEGEIISILVKVGDSVEEGAPIMEVETDKATVEIPSPFTGSIEAIKCEPGDIVHVGDALVIFSGDGAEAEEAPAGKKPEKEAERKPEEAERKPAETEEKKPEAKPEEKKEKVPAKAPEKREGPVPASPATRRLARELGVDLRDIPASGPEGLVTAEDVRSFAEGVKAKEKPAVTEPTEKEAPAEEREVSLALSPTGVAIPELPDFAKWGEVERIPVRSIRKATARQMALAWSQIPHVTSHDSIDVTKLEAFRQKHKAEVEAKGGKLSVTVFALKAAATALRAFPNFNATLDVKAGEIVRKKYYHIGVAAQTGEGLVVPVIRDVDRKSVIELSIELTELVERTRNRKVLIDEMRGGTFTITNVGPLGGGHFNPIINYPEVAIMGMGQARMQAVVINNDEGAHEIAPRLMMPISLTIDHRVLDGADAIAFVNKVKEVLQDPDELLMAMV